MAHQADRIGRQIRGERIAAAVALCVGGLLWAMVVSGYAALGFRMKVVAVLCGALAIWMACRVLRVNRARSYGRSVENRAVAAATDLLRHTDMQVTASRIPVPDLGDIDMVVAYRGHRVPVEIKSFHTWTGKDRCAHAVRQTIREAGALHARVGIIWLPASRSRLTRKVTAAFGQPSVWVVAGSPRRLAKAIRSAL